MSIIKKELIEGYIKSASDMSDYVKEEGKVVDYYDYYNECVSIISSISSENAINKLFDYYFFQLNKSKDLPRDVKKLYKILKIDPYNLLLIVKNLNSTCLRFSDLKYTQVPSEKLPSMFTLVGFFIFLIYVFDLCTSNKKLYVSDMVCSYKDLENVIAHAKKNISGFNSTLKGLLEIIYSKEPVPRGMKRVISTDLDLAFFQKFKMKHDFILSQHLCKTLLKDEYNYYSSRTAISDHVLASLLNEFEDKEFNLELTAEFYSLLRKRAYLVPYNGVSITPSKIKFSIDLYERQLNGENYLVIITNHEDISYYTFINLTRNYIVNTSPWLYDLCNFLYSFYKLKDVADEVYGKTFVEDPLFVINFKMDSFMTEPITVIKGNSSVYDDFIVESPYYWRYKGTPRKKINNKSFYNYNEGEGSFVYISAFKRRLPLGQKASDEAKNMSKLYCIDLEDNETLVSPFIRCSR